MSNLVKINFVPALPSAVDTKIIMARAFSLFFLMLSLTLAGIATYDFAAAFFLDGDAMANGLVKSVNIAVVSLAIFELGIGINKEYTSADDDHGNNIYSTVRRSITRFVTVVCVALVLEGLIMVIKYSQLDMAGNLGYPVAIIASASLLLLSLGGFLKLTANIENE